MIAYRNNTDTNPFTICELEVYGFRFNNIALHRPVTASSTYAGGLTYHMSYMTDGLYARVPFETNKCGVTDNDPQPWIMVELSSSPVFITRVGMAMRTDGNSFITMYIAVSNTSNTATLTSLPLCATVTTAYPQGATLDLLCNPIQYGRYLIIYHNVQSGIGNVCEIYVYSHQAFAITQAPTFVVNNNNIDTAYDVNNTLHDNNNNTCIPLAPNMPGIYTFKLFNTAMIRLSFQVNVIIDGNFCNHDGFFVFQSKFNETLISGTPPYLGVFNKCVLSKTSGSTHCVFTCVHSAENWFVYIKVMEIPNTAQWQICEVTIL